jgi:hypothetical protein
MGRAIDFENMVDAVMELSKTKICVSNAGEA